MSSRLVDNPVQRNYGVSVTDVDNDGRFEAFVTGNVGPTLVRSSLSLLSLSLSLSLSLFSLVVPHSSCSLTGAFVTCSCNVMAEQIYKWSGGSFVRMRDPVLEDSSRRAIGVAACDIDGDGREEIYVLNTDQCAPPLSDPSSPALKVCRTFSDHELFWVS